MSKAGVAKTIAVLVVGVAAGWFGRGLFGGGGGMPPMGMEMPPAAVKVLAVQEAQIAAPDEFIARVEAVQEVVIRPEVAGRIEEVHFTEGSIVKEGDPLVSIDRSSYHATADAAAAEVARTEKRYERLKRADKRSVSASDLESAESEYLRAKAAFSLAKVDLDRTAIKAPVAGRIGAAMVKRGNYVTPGGAELARIVQLDPIRVVFSQTDREYLAQRRRELAGDTGALEARALLPDGSTVPGVGKKDFDDNAINPATGTIAVRYLFDNPDRLLVPGGYVTVQLSNPEGEIGIKIPQRALLLDQDGSFVLAVDEAGVVGAMRVEVGDRIGADAVILSGLTPGTQIVTDGVQKAMPGATVMVIPTEG